MTAECMLDTNVLVYAVDESPEYARKKSVAEAMLGSLDFGLSAQVLQEFFVTVTKKIENPISHERALSIMERLEVFPLVPTTFGLVVEGVRNSVKYQVSYWDGAVLAAAERLGARVLYSEDLSDVRVYGGVKVVNPFD